MISKDEFIALLDEVREQDGEWSTDDAVVMSFREGEAIARVAAKVQELKQIRELIEKSHQERSNKNDQ